MERLGFKSRHLNNHLGARARLMARNGVSNYDIGRHMYTRGLRFVPPNGQIFMTREGIYMARGQWAGQISMNSIPRRGLLH